MAGVDKSSPYRNLLTGMINSIDQIIPLKPENQVLIDDKTGNLKRIIRSENVKDVEQYISRIDEMIERKGEILWL